MRIGRMRYRIVLQRATETQSASGEVSEAWSTTLATVWGSVEPLRAEELLRAKQANSTTTHRVVIRTPASSITLTSRDRLSINSIVYAIDGITQRPERGEMEILCHVND